MNLLSVKDLRQSFTEIPLYDGVSFGVNEGEKIAVVGPNGCGKTTLLRVLMGQLEPDRGEIAMRQGVTLAYLAQQVSFVGHETAREVVARAVLPVKAAILEHDALTARILELGDHDGLQVLLTEQDLLQQRIDKLGGWDWERRVEEMLDRLGLEPQLDMPVGRLSGGQQRRVDLARVLLEAPDLLLLDEPTNHLDPDTVDWLEGWLKKKVRGLLLITHDRYFLERVVDRILEVSAQGFFDYPGKYEVFMQRKLARMNLTQKVQSREQKLIGEELEKLKIASTSRDSPKRLQLEERFRALKYGDDGSDALMRMSLARGKELGPLILTARGVRKRLGEQELFVGADFDMIPGDKIGLVGPNGSGKTTFVRMLLGELRPNAGVIERGDETQVAYLRQHGPPLDPKLTLYEALGPSNYVWVGDTRHHKRRYLEMFLFDAGDFDRPVRLLSGGQKRRLQLARVVAKNANVLVLDEPTNDLDILSLQALEVALEDFQGCVLVVSHDRYFLNRVCNVIVSVEGGRLVRYKGNYDVYRRARERAQQREREARADERAKQRQERHTRAERERTSTALSRKERDELSALEQVIGAHEQRIEQLEERLQDPALYERADVGQRLERISGELAQERAGLEASYEAWMALESRRG